MRIEKVQYQDYRSIQEAAIDNCGNLNILVGKNNSGKSNLLKAIKNFFDLLNVESLVSIMSPLEARREVFQIDESKAEKATISLTIFLDEESREQLVGNLTDEAPQLRNAVDNIRNLSKVEITLTICENPAMAYVSTIALLSSGRGTKSNLIEVPREVAAELRQRATKINVLRKEISAITKFSNSEELRMYREERYRHMLTHRINLSGESGDRVTADISHVLEAAEDDAATQEGLLELIAKRRESAAKLKAAPFEGEVKTFAGQASVFPDYILNLMQRIKSTNVLYLDENRKPVGEEEARRLLTLKMRRGGDANLKAIQAAVSDLLGVQIDAFESSSNSLPLSSRSAEMDVDNFLVQLNGSGIREALRLILDVSFEEPEILLLEEPEVHLHPALEYSLLQYLKKQSERRQIFLTTHSSNFLDTPSLSSVYLVSKAQSTAVNLVQYDDFGAELSGELGIRLSSVFMFNKIVFVEGASDELILRELASKLRINLAQSGAGFVRMQGARGLSYYANSATLTMLAKRSVEVHFVIDRDERTEGDLKRINATCSEHAEVHVLPKREIENFLIDTDALRSLILHKSSNLTNPSLEEIQVAINEEVELLQEEAILKRFTHDVARSVHFDRKAFSESTSETCAADGKSEIERMISELTEMTEALEQARDKSILEVKNNWPASKLDLVPGTELLDAVLKRFGLRYRKERDGEIIARNMKVENINPYLHALIQIIAK